MALGIGTLDDRGPEQRNGANIMCVGGIRLIFLEARRQLIGVPQEMCQLTARAAESRSAGMGRRRRQVIEMGRSPRCST